MNLNVEGRKLKQAAMAAVQHFSGSAKSLPVRSGPTRPIASSRSEGFERSQQPLSMEVMLQLQSLDSSMHDGVNSAVPGHGKSYESTQQSPPSPNGYLIQQTPSAAQVDEGGSTAERTQQS
jgi:hypothetical protein